jgi:renalase
VADLGAQYLTQTARADVALYEELVEAGVLTPMTCDVVGKRGEKGLDFAAPRGTSRVVHHLLGDASVHYGRRLVRLEATEDGAWSASSDDGTSERFAAVVLTIPVPQMLQLEGSVKVLLEGKGLEAVEYSSRYAAVLTFPRAELRRALPAPARYVSAAESEVVRWVSRGLGPERESEDEAGEEVLLAHSSVEFGARYSLAGKEGDERVRTMGAAEADVRAAVSALLPTLPEPSGVRMHWWRYSQVTRASPAISDAVLVVQERPLLILAGDGIVGESKFDACVESGRAAARALLEHLKPT